MSSFTRPATPMGHAGLGVENGVAGSCPAEVDTAAQDLGPDTKTELRHARLLTLTIRGDHAVASDSTEGTADRFMKITGRWYISAGFS